MTRSTPDERNEPSAEARRIASLDTLARLHLVAAGLLLTVAVLWLFSDVLLLMFASILLACQLRAAARMIQRRARLPYGLALAAVVLGIGGALLALGYWRGPRLIGELYVVYDQINDQVGRLWQQFGHADWFKSIMDHVHDYIGNRGSALAGRAATFVTGTLGSLGSLLLILVAGVYFATSAETYRDGLVALMPRTWRSAARDVLIEEGRALKRWFVGQLVDMAAIGLMTGIGLWLLGVPLFLTLGLIAALANFVPYIGALAGSLPAIVIALGTSPRTAIEVAVLFIIVQTIEGNLISPLISRRTVDLPPVLTLFSQTVLGSLFGPLGLILATPITAAAMVLVRMVYVERILGEAPRTRSPAPTTP